MPDPVMLASHHTYWVGSLLLAVAVYPTNLSAQPRPLTPIEGFESHMVHIEPGSPFALRGFAIDSKTSTLYLSINNRVLRRETNGNLTELLRFPPSESTGLFCIPSGSAELLFTNFNTNRFYRHDLQTRRTTSFSGIKNAFDVDLTPQGHILVSANPNWPSSGAETSIYVLDPRNGNHRKLIQLTGPSGPLLTTPSGGLLYAIQSATFPTPRGSVRLVEFTSGQIANALITNSPIPLAAGLVVLQGLDGATDLVMDDRDRLYLSDSQRGGILRTWPGRYDLEPGPFVQQSKLVTLGLAFVDSGVASMDSYQPESGASLYVCTTDWMISGEVRCIQPRRPLLEVSPNPAPKGPLDIKISAAPANAATWVGISLLSGLAERPVFFAQGVSLYLGLDFQVPPFLLTGTTDAQGKLLFGLTNPGQLLLTLNVQSLISGAPKTGFVQVGTTNLEILHIKP